MRVNLLVRAIWLWVERRAAPCVGTGGAPSQWYGAFSSVQIERRGKGTQIVPAHIRAWKTSHWLAKSLRKLGFARRDAPVITVSATPSCDARRLPGARCVLQQIHYRADRPKGELGL